MGREPESHVCGALFDGFAYELEQVNKMTEWNGRRLEEFVRKMGLRRTPGQGKIPIHLSLYGPSRESKPLLTKIISFDAKKWRAMDYTETDRVSVT